MHGENRRFWRPRNYQFVHVHAPDLLYNLIKNLNKGWSKSPTAQSEEMHGAASHPVD